MSPTNYKTNPHPGSFVKGHHTVYCYPQTHYEESEFITNTPKKQRLVETSSCISASSSPIFSQVASLLATTHPSFLASARNAFFDLAKEREPLQLFQNADSYKDTAYEKGPLTLLSNVSGSTTPLIKQENLTSLTTLHSLINTAYSKNNSDYPPSYSVNDSDYPPSSQKNILGIEKESTSFDNNNNLDRHEDLVNNLEIDPSSTLVVTKKRKANQIFFSSLGSDYSIFRDSIHSATIETREEIASNHFDQRATNEKNSPFDTKGLSDKIQYNLSPCETFSTDGLKKEDELLSHKGPSTLKRTAHNETISISNLTDGIPLSSEEDENWLSPCHQFIRSMCVEFFCATKEDIGERRYKNKKISLGQVGVRCVFCSHVPLEIRAGRSYCFPSSTVKMYQSVIMMLHKHFNACPCIPNRLKDTYNALKTKSRPSKNDSKRYWIKSAKDSGLVDTSKGMYFEKSLHLPKSKNGGTSAAEADEGR